MGSFPDIGPQPDGTRTAEQWLAAIGDDASIIARNIKETIFHQNDIDKVQNIAVALKEAERLKSDIIRFAQEVHGITREEILKVRL